MFELSFSATKHILNNLCEIYDDSIQIHVISIKKLSFMRKTRTNIDFYFT